MKPSPTLASAPPILRELLFSSDKPREITSKIDSLDRAYTRKFNRKLPVDLFMSDLPGFNRGYGVTAYYTPEHRPAVEFLKQEAAA